MLRYFVNTGWRFKASEKILVNRVLLSPIRENIKYPKGLPRKIHCVGSVGTFRILSIVLPTHLVLHYSIPGCGTSVCVWVSVAMET